MIYTLKNCPKKSSAQAYERYFKAMIKELNLVLAHWEHKATSGDCKKAYPDFSKGYVTAIKEILG